MESLSTAHTQGNGKQASHFEERRCKEHEDIFLKHQRKASPLRIIKL
jgi:hypothetical protein